ncbi:hypothetical protein ANAPH2_00811 [Anaplasma phagocytophilum]|nr:hypothetical protein ANAPH2_00811 [Anaplasma phagocytophilum]
MHCAFLRGLSLSIIVEKFSKQHFHRFSRAYNRPAILLNMKIFKENSVKSKKNH